ncbi:hypothetical protein CNR22_01045 [Sphingobacteriaceae bacterium]|nr:hypothetical protein CNR22_01045 [Sphingobacteriaceae bacterium]
MFRKAKHSYVRLNYALRRSSIPLYVSMWLCAKNSPTDFFLAVKKHNSKLPNPDKYLFLTNFAFHTIHK